MSAAKAILTVSDVEQLRRKMPEVLFGSACDDARDVSELLDLARNEVDLSDEGHDGAISPIESRRVNKWIKQMRKRKPE